MEEKQAQLLQFIREVSFAVTDIVLYLDTHPCDADAMKYFEKYNKLKTHALEEYASMYGPITVEGAKEGCYWSWIDGNWPWKGEE